MNLKKYNYIKKYLNLVNFSFLKIKKYYFIYYTTLIFFFFKYINFFIIWHRVIEKNFYFKNYYEDYILHRFLNRNCFIYLNKDFYISYGFLKSNKKKKNYLFVLLIKYFLKNVIDDLNNNLNFYYIKLNKKIPISYNLYLYFFTKINKNIFQFDYYIINSIFIKEKKIFGYTRLKKLPRKKKFLIKKF